MFKNAYKHSDKNLHTNTPTHMYIFYERMCVCKSVHLCKMYINIDLSFIPATRILPTNQPSIQAFILSASQSLKWTITSRDSVCMWVSMNDWTKKKTKNCLRWLKDEIGCSLKKEEDEQLLLLLYAEGWRLFDSNC